MFTFLHRGVCELHAACCRHIMIRTNCTSASDAAAEEHEQRLALPRRPRVRSSPTNWRDMPRRRTRWQAGRPLGSARVKLGIPTRRRIASKRGSEALPSGSVQSVRSTVEPDAHGASWRWAAETTGPYDARSTGLCACVTDTFHRFEVASPRGTTWWWSSWSIARDNIRAPHSFPPTSLRESSRSPF